MSLQASKSDTIAALKQVQIVAECIRAAKVIPSGHLYAQLMGYGVGLNTYEKIINVLVKAELVAKTNHVLAWTGE